MQQDIALRAPYSKGAKNSSIQNELEIVGSRPRSALKRSWTEIQYKGSLRLLGALL